MELHLKEIGHGCDSNLGRTQDRVQWRAVSILDVTWILIPRNYKYLVIGYIGTIQGMTVNELGRYGRERS
jgi:hypothetical protein